MNSFFSEHESLQIRDLLIRKKYSFLQSKTIIFEKTKWNNSLRSGFDTKELVSELQIKMINNRFVHLELNLQIEDDDSHSIAIVFVKENDEITIEVFDGSAWHPLKSVAFGNFEVPGYEHDDMKKFAKRIRKVFPYFGKIKAFIADQTKIFHLFLGSIYIDLTHHYKVVKIVNMNDMSLNPTHHCNTITLYYHQLRDQIGSTRDMLEIMRKLRLYDCYDLFKMLSTKSNIPFLHSLPFDKLLKRKSHHIPIQWDPYVKYQHRHHLQIDSKKLIDGTQLLDHFNTHATFDQFYWELYPKKRIQ
jgi:hypothetical protein